MTEPEHKPLLEVRGVEVKFDADLAAVAGVSLSVPANTAVGLVGESGSGKTTLAKTLVGLRRPTRGQVELAGRDIYASGRRDRLWLSRQVQMIFQDSAASLSPRFSVRRLLMEPLRIHRLPISEQWDFVREIAAVLGLSEVLFDQYPHQLSGGQARRVAIARALVLKPRLIVADEPTAGLDISIQGDLLNLLRRVQRLYGLSYFIVSHNLNVIGRITDRVGVMYLGKLVEVGPTDAVFRRFAHPYTQALLAANPVIDPQRKRPKIILKGEIPSPRRPPPGCRFHTRCPRAQPRCAVEEPDLKERDAGHSVACHFPVSSD